MRKKNSVDQGALALLLGFFRSQHEEMLRVFGEIRLHGHPGSKSKNAYCGFLLHNLYTAAEDLFKEIAKTFENKLEDSDRYHQELLRRMSFEVPGIRPALLSERSQVLLDELRSFRHMFRHAYGHELDSEKLEVLRRSLLKKWHYFQSDLKRFESFLKKRLAK